MPKVKGLLYDLVFTKVAEGTNTALSGATFKLQQNENGTWQDVTDSGGNLITATSDDSGMVAFTGLQYSTYRAVETKAPRGYKSTDGSGNSLAWEPSTPLCWTTSSANLMSSRAGSANVMAAASDGATVADPRSISLMVLKQDENLKPLVGTTFTLVKNGGVASSAVETASVDIIKDGVSETAAAATFDDLENGTYTLTETRVAAGYLAGSESSYTITLSNAGVSIADSEGTPQSLNTLTCNDTSYYYLTVTNYALPELPATGGMGIAYGYAAGTAALLVATAILVRRHRRIVRG